MLSDKSIPVRERLIVALDAESCAQARQWVDQLDDAVEFYKVGLTLIFEPGFWALFEYLGKRGKKAFADIKFFDVPETVKTAVEKVAASGAIFATVHAQEAMVRAALAARGKSALKVLAVTALTSLDQGDIQSLGFGDVSVEKLVLDRSRRMLELGCDGVISSGLEVAKLRDNFGDRFLVVVPGIRPVANVDDQKRTVNVEQAFQAGADYIVVGRPIYQDANPKAAAEAVQQRIAQVFAARS